LGEGEVKDEAPPVIQKTYEFVLWLVKKVEGFPRSHRFTVGDRLTSTSLDLLSALVEAAYSKEKEPRLEAASRSVNSIRYLLRLAKDLKLISVDSYGFSAGSLDEVGRMVGGWRKAAGLS
jgi:four helix bundle protein